ncbi:hypothetical protein, partial [Mycoplasma struthionis]
MPSVINKIPNAEARHHLDEKEKEISKYIASNANLYSLADPTITAELQKNIASAKSEIAERVVVNPRRNTTALNIKDASVYKAIEDKLKLGFDNIQEPAVTEYQKNEYTKTIDNWSSVFNPEQIKKLKEKIKDSSITSIDKLNEEKAKLEHVKSEAEKVRNLSSLLSDEEKNKAISAIIEAKDSRVDQAANVDLANKKLQLIEILENKQQFPKLEKVNYIKKINNATTLSQLNEIENNFPRDNSFELLKEKISYANNYINENRNLLDEATPESKQNLEEKIRLAQADVDAGVDSHNKQVYDDHISKIDEALNLVTKDKLLNALKEKLIKDLKAIDPQLDPSNDAKLNNYIKNAQDESAIRQAFEKAKAVKNNVKELNKLSELSPQALLNAQNDLATAVGDNANQTNILDLAKKKNELLSNFDNNYPNLVKDKANHKNAIEALADSGQVEQKKQDLEKLNSQQDLANKVKEAQEYFDQHQPIYKAATTDKQNAFDLALQNAKNATNSSATLKEVPEYNQLKQELQNALDAISEANVLKDLRDALKEKVRQMTPPFDSTQIQTLVNKLDNQTLNTPDLLNKEFEKIENVKNNAVTVKALSQLSPTASTDTINNLITNIDDQAAQLTNVTLAEKKNEILTTLNNQTTYPNLNKAEEQAEVEKLASISDAPALLEKLATKNELKNLEKKIQAAQNVITQNGEQIGRINPTGKQELETEINNANTLKAQKPTPTKKEILDKIKLLDQKMEAVSHDNLIKKLREQKIKEITDAQPTHISSSNLQKLVDKIQDPRLSTEQEINSAFNNAKKAKDAILEVQKLGQLSSQAQTNIENKIVNATGNDQLISTIKDVATKQNELLAKFDNNTFPKLSKQTEQPNIEALDSAEAVANKEKELKNENAKRKLQEIVEKAREAQRNNDVYSKAESNKKLEFDQKLREAEQALQGNLQEASVYDKLTADLSTKTEDVKLPAVLEHQKSETEKIISTYNPPMTSQQVDSLKAKIKDAKIQDLQQLEAELNKIKKVKEKVDEINSLTKLSTAAKQEAYNKLIEHIEESSKQDLDTDLAKQKDALLRQIETKQSPYNNLTLDLTITSEIESAKDANALDALKQKYAVRNKIEELKKLKEKSSDYKTQHSSDLDEADPDGKSELEKQIKEAEAIIAKGESNQITDVERKITELQNALDAVQVNKYLQKFRDKKVKEISTFKDALSGTNINDLNAKVNDTKHNTIDLIKAEFEKAKKVHENAKQLDANNELSPSTIEKAKNALVSNYGVENNQKNILDTAKAKQDLLSSFDKTYPNLVKADKKQHIEGLADVAAVNQYKNELEKEDAKNDLDKKVKEMEAYLAKSKDVYDASDPQNKTAFDKALADARAALTDPNLKTKEEYKNLKDALDQKLVGVQETAAVTYQKGQKKQDVQNSTNEFDHDQQEKLKTKYDAQDVTTLSKVNEVSQKVNDTKQLANQIKSLPNLDGETQKRLVGKLIDHFGDNTEQANDLKLAQKISEVLGKLNKTTYPFLTGEEISQLTEKVKKADYLDNLVNNIVKEIENTNKWEELKAKKKQAEDYKAQNPEVIKAANPADVQELEAILNKSQQDITTGQQVGKDTFEEDIRKLNEALAKVSADKVLKELKQRQTTEVNGYNNLLTQGDINNLVSAINDIDVNTVEKANNKFAEIQALKAKAQEIEDLEQLTPAEKTKLKTQLVNNLTNPTEQQTTVDLAKAKNKLLKDLNNSNWPKLTKAQYQTQIESLNTKEEVENYRTQLDKDNEKALLDELIKEIEDYKKANPIVLDNANELDKTTLDNLIAKAKADTNNPNNLPSKEEIAQKIADLKEAYNKIKRDYVTNSLREKINKEIESYGDLSSQDQNALKNQITPTFAPKLEDLLEKQKENQKIVAKAKELKNLQHLSSNKINEAITNLANAFGNEQNQNNIVSLAKAKDAAINNLSELNGLRVPTTAIQNFTANISDKDTIANLEAYKEQTEAAKKAAEAILASKIDPSSQQLFLDKIGEDK